MTMKYLPLLLLLTGCCDHGDKLPTGQSDLTTNGAPWLYFTLHKKLVTYAPVEVNGHKYILTSAGFMIHDESCWNMSHAHYQTNWVILRN